MNDQFPPPGYVWVESKLDGIEVYQPAPVAEEKPVDMINFDCPQCGATTAYNVSDGGLTCAHCGFYEPPKQAVIGKRAQEFEFTVETMERSAQGWGEARKDLECQNCGAVTSLPIENLTHTCVFCGSNKVVQRNAQQNILRPLFMIPFKIEIDACYKIARQWLGSSWMTPAVLKNADSVRAFMAVYLPFWTFDAVTTADWRAEVGHSVTEQYYDASDKSWKSRTRVEWRWESGNVQLHIDDLPVPGTQRLSKLHLNNIREFDLQQLVLYDPNYLAGLQAKAYDIPLEAAWEISRQEMRETTRKSCREQASTSDIRNFSMNLDFSEESWRYVLLPVYVAAYQYAEQVYQVVVNGQSGSISGPRPVDWQKVWLAIAAIMSPGVLLGLLGLVTLPLAGAGLVIGGIGFVLLIIGLVISITMYMKASHMDDV